MKKYKKIISLCLAVALVIGGIEAVSADVSEYTKEQKDFIYYISAGYRLNTFEKYSEYCSKQDFDFTEDDIKLLYDKYYNAIIEGSDGHVYLKEGLAETDDRCACDWASLIPIIDPDTLESIYETRRKNSIYYVPPEIAFERTRASDFDVYCSLIPTAEDYTTEQLMLLYEDYKQRWCEKYDKYADANYSPHFSVIFKNGYELTEPTVEDYSYLIGLQFVYERVSTSGLVSHAFEFETLEDAVAAKEILRGNVDIISISSFAIEAYAMTIIDDDQMADFSILETTQPFYADLDGDYIAGKVADVVLLSKYIQGAIQLSDETKLAADLNIDGAIDTEDLQIIVNYLTNEITVLP
ncbi:MAG: dockerin type I repeat-containing protein, partial [Oscillospiraceae bacterium]|nr:dockerin type I repeat-containing protein [Oscillospiraceae bacterium]